MEPKTKNDAHPADRIRARLGEAERDGVERQQISGRVMLSLNVASRIADLLDVLARLRGESLVDAAAGADPVNALLAANERDLERQTGGRVWTVRLILPHAQSSQSPPPPSFSELLNAGAFRTLDLTDDRTVVELTAPDNVRPQDRYEWANRCATMLHDLGFSAVPAPAWGRE